MHYYIDGYNFLFRLSSSTHDLKYKREQFIRELNQKVALLGLEVTLVFDAPQQVGMSSRSHYNALEIIFTAHGETADEFILAELQSSPSVREEVVVTSDKELALRARRKHAKSESIESFFQAINQRYKNKVGQKKELRTLPAFKPPPILHKKVETPLSSKKQREESPPPKPSASAEECFDYYLSIFEKEMAASEDQATSRNKKMKPASEYISEMERWRRAFESLLNEEK